MPSKHLFAKSSDNCRISWCFSFQFSCINQQWQSALCKNDSLNPSADKHQNKNKQFHCKWRQQQAQLEIIPLTRIRWHISSSWNFHHVNQIISGEQRTGLTTDIWDALVSSFYLPSVWILSKTDKNYFIAGWIKYFQQTDKIFYLVSSYVKLKPSVLHLCSMTRWWENCSLSFSFNKICF